MINQVKLLSITFLLTLLIWVTADQLQVVTATLELALRFQPREAGSDMVVKFSGSDSPVFKVQVSGPRRAVLTVQDMQNLTVTAWLADRPTTQNERIPDLLSLLREDPGPLKDLVIDKIDPPEASVTIDRWVEVDVPVVIAQPLRLGYGRKPELNVSQVRVRMWDSRLKELGGRLPTLEVPIEHFLAAKRKGDDFFFRAPVPLDALGPDASCEPATVEVTGRLAAQELETRELGTVAIRACLSFDYLQRRIVLEPEGGGTVVTRKITVQGTPDALLQLSATPVYGVVNLREDQLKRVGEDQLIQPDVFLPEGVKMLRPPDPVKLKIVSVSEE